MRASTCGTSFRASDLLQTETLTQLKTRFARRVFPRLRAQRSHPFGEHSPARLEFGDGLVGVVRMLLQIAHLLRVPH